MSPWPGGSVGWSMVPCTKWLQVRSLWGHIQDTTDRCFSYINVSLSFLFPSSLSKINKHILGYGSKKKRKKSYTYIHLSNRDF